MLPRIESLAWTAGVVLLLFYGAVRVWAEQERATGLERARNARPEAWSESVDGTSNPAWAQRSGRAPDQSTWSKQRIAAFAASVSSPGEPVGLLYMPALELEVPVYSGASEINLNRGAAHIDGTAPLGQPAGNIGIAAHRDGFFRKLRDARLGQELFIEHGGRSRRYLVSELGIVRPTDVAVLAPTATPSVTLVTCYPFHFIGSAPLRYVVRAELDTASPREAGGTELSASRVRDSRTRRDP